MNDTNSVRSRRKRLHAVGDHSVCRSERCPAAGTVGTVVVPPLPPLTAVKGGRSSPERDAMEPMALPRPASLVAVPDSVAALRDAIIAETADQDDTIKAMAIRLAELTAVSGPAGVAAARALAELVSSLREAA